MFCGSCGEECPEGAAWCPSCGARLQRGAGAPAEAPGRPPNYLVHAILVTLLCCLPLGIVGIVYAAQVDGRWSSGDVRGARQASDQARFWSMLGLGLGLAAALVWLILAAFLATGRATI